MPKGKGYGKRGRPSKKVKEARGIASKMVMEARKKIAKKRFKPKKA